MTRSVQTGFPYPSQHTGWALAEPLIAPSPHRLEDLNILPALLSQKETAARALSKRGSLLATAKKRLKRTLESVEKHKEEFLYLHKKLCSAILSSAPCHLVTDEAEKTITRHFQHLDHPDQIAERYHTINQKFIVQPFEALSVSWTQQTDKELLSNDPTRSYNAAKAILYHAITNATDSLQHEKQYPEELTAFMLCMGKILGCCSLNIILQYFSEIIEFAPPPLSDFEKKIQSAAYRQLETFLTTLDAPVPEDPFTELKNSLLTDIRIFTHKEDPHPIVTELETYYHQRFFKDRCASIS